MKKWNSFKEFFEELNKEKYTILRNHETMMEDIYNGGDIDILCEKKQCLVEHIHAFPRAEREVIFNYWVIIEGRKVPIDIREIGDGYYDEKWEKSMLYNRIKTVEYFILDDENYKYSLLYHAIVHKPFISEKYIKMIGNMFGKTIKNDENTDRLLCNYMTQMGYSISRPIDRGVSFNKESCARLQKILA